MRQMIRILNAHDVEAILRVRGRDIEGFRKAIFYVWTDCMTKDE